MGKFIAALRRRTPNGPFQLATFSWLIQAGHLVPKMFTDDLRRLGFYTSLARRGVLIERGK